MMNFCTLFDSGYLPRGLTLYESLCNTCDVFHLYIMAFDDKAFDVLNSFSLPYITVVQLKDFEDDKLLKVKPTRTRAEYCWTCGPSVIYYFITKFQLDSCTYLDADLFFYRSPHILFDEIGDNSIGITDHYAPYVIPQGRYCVQFMFFRNDEWGMKALTWWRDSCIEWCFARFDGDGKFGDQKYLEQFPTKFKKVHIIQSRGAGIASWNMQQYLFNNRDWTFTFKDEQVDIVFVHYHGLGLKIEDNCLYLKSFTFDIDNNVRFLFDHYVRYVALVCNKYLGGTIQNTKLLNRSIIKRLISIAKLKLRDNQFIRYLYEKFFRPEYKGDNEKLC